MFRPQSRSPALQKGDPISMLKSITIITSALLHVAIAPCLWLGIAEFAVAEIPTQGLVAYYPFDGDARDASGHENHGTVSGAWLTTDKFGNSGSAYDFDGVRSFIELPLCISPSVMPQATIVAWAKAEQVEHIATVLSNANSWPSRTIQMRHSPDRGACWATNSNGFSSRVWHEVERGKWTFLAITYDQAAGKLRFQVDDQRFEYKSKQNEGVENLFIGKSPLSGEFFGGQIDEVRVYDRVLDRDEIAALYLQFKNGMNPATPQAIHENKNRRKLATAFFAGFSVFVLLLLALNLWIRRKA